MLTDDDDTNTPVVSSTRNYLSRTTLNSLASSHRLAILFCMSEILCAILSLELLYSCRIINGNHNLEYV